MQNEVSWDACASSKERAQGDFQVKVSPFPQQEMLILLQKTLEKRIWLSYWRQKNDQRERES